MATGKSDHWSEYWSRGCLTSLPQDFSANYDGEVAEFWQRVFCSISHLDRMIDLCTGNGAIALLAADYAQKKAPGLNITAVDAATVSPQAILQKYPAQARLLDRIRFIDNCRVEDIDLPASTFDLVTSQYGIEYCDWQLAAVKVQQLLKPGGRLVLVTHTATSDIMKFMEQEQREYTQLEQLRFFSAIKGYLSQEISFAQLRSRLARIQVEIGSIFSKSGSPLFRSVLGMLAGALQMDQAALEKERVHLEEYYAQIRHGFDRLTDMLRVNHAIRSDPDWYRVFVTAGLELEDSGEIRYKGRHHAGSFFIFTKPGDNG